MRDNLGNRESIGKDEKKKTVRSFKALQTVWYLEILVLVERW